MREDAAWSPILREQGALEELAAIGVEIIRNARNELYLSMRFLDVALNGLFPVADNSIKGIGTDGTLLSFETGYICGWYRRNPVYVNRMILHETFHCLFVHPWSRKKRTEEYWNLACDIAVESLTDGIHKPCVHLPMSPVRAEFYGRLRKKIKVLNAESIYHTMQEMELSEIEYERLCREFCRDDHSRWEKEDEKKSPNPNRNRKNDWDDKREKMQAEMEAFSNEAADDSRELMDQMAVENRERYDYRKFLQKFSVLKETVQIDPDAFDYVFYNYGMQLYGNMPLIEPQETKEVYKVEDFVIAIDTSMSCKGELVKQFLRETYSVLSESESFFRKVRIHIIQCDDRIQSDTVITNEKELQAYMESFEVRGQGGTDFRPVFAYVNELIKKKAFHHLRGLIYFTDGYGTFPVKRPLYETAFVFMKEDYRDVDVPIWAMKLIIEPEEFSGKVEAEWT